MNEKLKIAEKFLLASPPGGFSQVLRDVQVLLGEDLSGALPIFRKCNTEHMVSVSVPDTEHKVLLTKYGEVDSNKYLDPRGQQVISVDHFRRECVGREPRSFESEVLEPIRAAVDVAVGAYVKEHYEDGEWAVYAPSPPESNGSVSNVPAPASLVVCITDSRFSPSSFWGGTWRSVWHVVLSAAGDAGEATGDLRIHVHYFEDGNVQLQSKSTAKLTLTFQDVTAESIAKEITEKIERAEGDFASSVCTRYDELSRSTFKDLRRTLPITMQRFAWNRVAVHRVVSELHSKC